MSDDSVTFRLDGEVTIEKLTDAFAKFNAVLRGLEVEQKAHVRWIVAGLEYGSATVTARPEALDEASVERLPFLAEAYLSAGRQVAAGELTGRPLLTLVRDLTDLSDHQNGVVIETAEDDVIFLAPVAAPAAAVLSDTTMSFAVVRGRVETLSHRGQLRFTLFDLVSDRAVSCYLKADHENLMRNAWGRIADVAGDVKRDADSGRPLSIRKVTSVELVEEGTRDGYRQARGVVSGATEPAERTIRRIRDAS